MDEQVANMDEQVASLERRLEVLKTKTDDLEKLNPEEIRDKYDLYWNMIEDRETFINKVQEYINKNMYIIQAAQESLQKQQELINEINELYDKMKKKLNESRKGTLQGLTRQTIKESELLPNDEDEIGKNALEQPYSEAEDIQRNRNNNIGGKKRRIKNKTHKKRKNKNKKSRRFIRNK